MFDPTWAALALIALVGGVSVILVPKQVASLNRYVSHAIGSVDELVLRHRHVVGTVSLIVAYLCFRLALLVKHL